MASDTVAAVVDRVPCHPRSPTAATTTQIRSRGNVVHWKLTYFETRIFLLFAEK